MHIREIVLGAADEAALMAVRRFYGDTLGLPVDHEQAGEIAFRVGESRLVFVSGAGTPRYHFAFNIPENQLEAARDWITQFVHLIPGDDGSPILHFPAWNAHSIYFYDPLGNVGELIARHGLPTASQVPFSAASLLNISEIGIPSPDVLGDATRWSERVGESFYLGNSSENFTAIGDEYGLLIVVSVGREWYPRSGVPAQDRPLSVIVDGLHGNPIDVMA